MKDDWSVLLIGGPSGAGKTTAAKAIARERGVTWVQVDDLRLVFQASKVRLPDTEATRALFLEDNPDIWKLPAARLCAWLILVGEAMSEAAATVIGNHIVQRDPVVIEGDGILPSIVRHPDLRGFVASGELRPVFIVPGSEDELLRNIRDRGVPGRSGAVLRRITEMNWRYSQWLERETATRAIPVVQTQPWESLAVRTEKSA